MTIVFDTGIPKLDALRVKPFPARRAKVDRIVRAGGSHFAFLPPSTVFTTSARVTDNPSYAYREIHGTAEIVIKGIIALGLLNASDISAIDKKRKDAQRARHRNTQARYLREAAQELGIKLTKAQLAKACANPT